MMQQRNFVADLDLSDQPTPEPLKAVDLGGLLEHQFPKREYILNPAIQLGSLNMIYASRGVGKTHVAIGLAYAAACGGSFWNWDAERSFRTLYLDGEMPGEVLQERISRVVAGSAAQPQPDFFRVLTIDLCGGVMPDLATREGQAVIADECEQAELIIVDNLSCLVRGNGRENESQSWLPVADWALNLRSRGKAVVFIHHSGKDGRQRGTSRREDLLDLSISLSRPSDYEPDQGARFEVRFEKARHLIGEQAQPFEAWLKLDEQKNPSWALKSISETTLERVVDLANLEMTQKEIADELGVNKSTVCRHHRTALERGLIKKKEKKSRSKPAKSRADIDG